ncbi:unnamed protein product, partial [Amoebophrya sp. A25]|eukprot:GSA25T00013958001.1
MTPLWKMTADDAQRASSPEDVELHDQPYNMNVEASTIKSSEQVKTRPRVSELWQSYLSWMCLSGVFLGFHFACWVWSLEHTSLLHSLMCVTSYPLFFHLWRWFLYAMSLTGLCGLRALDKTLTKMNYTKNCDNDYSGEIQRVPSLHGRSDVKSTSDDCEIRDAGDKENKEAVVLGVSKTMRSAHAASIAEGPLTSPGGILSRFSTSGSLFLEFRNAVMSQRNAAPGTMESAGIALSLLGVACLVLGPSLEGGHHTSEGEKGNAVTIHGDLVACVSAICMCIYLLIGKRMVSWC